MVDPRISIPIRTTLRESAIPASPSALPRLWHRLTRQGMPAGISPERERHIVLTNGAAAIITLVSLGNLATVLYIEWDPLILLLSIVYGASAPATIVFNSWGAHLRARVFFAGMSLLFITAVSLLTGGRVDFHFYLLALVLLTLFLFPAEERRVTLLFVALSLFVFVAIAMWPVFLPELRPVLFGPETASFFRLCTHIGMAAASTGFAYYIYVTQRRAEAALARERQRSEALLKSILPQPIIERLKEDESFIADRIERASVLFADIVNFTPLAERISPEELVRLLDEIFSQFDGAAARLGLEKIKTVGDAYMVVGGVPEPTGDSIETVVEMALEMQRIMQRSFDGALQLRIGIHSGSVVAGVIGRKRFAYDLWGDTVNVASRLEAHGVPGKIHVSPVVWEAVRDRYICEPRGAVAIKGKGQIETYFVEGRIEPLALGSGPAVRVQPTSTLAG